MIDKIHNMADTILGINSIKQYELSYTLIIDNNNNKSYYVEILSNDGTKNIPIKQTRDSFIYYNLSQGIYYLKCYSDDSKQKQVYYEEICVSKEMNNQTRTIIL